MAFARPAVNAYAPIAGTVIWKGWTVSCIPLPAGDKPEYAAGGCLSGERKTERMNLEAIGIVITTYNVKEKVLEAINAVGRQTTEIPCRLLVVDSGSTDGTADAVREAHPQIEVIRVDENIGPARARNIGFEHFAGLSVICLDSDMIIEPEAVDALAACVGEGVGSVCGTYFSTDGSRQCTAFRRPTLVNFAARLYYLERFLPVCLTEKYTEAELCEPATPFWCGGGFTLYTRAALDAAGGKDESFFVYGEELDHAHRIRDAGFDIVYTPAARALHYGSSSTIQNIAACRSDAYRGLLLYWKKNRPLCYPFVFLIVVLRLSMIMVTAPFLMREDKWEIFRGHREILGKLLRRN